MVDLTPSFLCDDNPPSPDLTNSAAAMARGNCTFSEKARLVQQYGGKVALIVSKQPLVSRKNKFGCTGVEFRWSWGTAILALEKFELMRAPRQFQ